MKRTLLVAVMALMLTPAVFAQVYKLDEKKILQQIKDSDEAIANEKRAARGQTWLDRGDVMYTAATAVSEKIFGGMTLPILTSQRGKDYTTSTKQLTGETYTVISYPTVDVYLLNDVVQFWEEKMSVYPDAIQKAIEAYRKAAELDPKLQGKAIDGLKRVADLQKQAAFNHHSLNQTVQAAENFRAAYDIQIAPPMNVIDTASVFNAGYLYLIKEDYQKAIENLTIARDAGYWNDGNVGYYLMYAYMQTDQNEKAKEIITETAKLFPQNNTVIEGLVNYYSVAEEDFTPIKDIVVKALEKDPNNLVLLNGLAQIYIKENNMDKAIEFYTRFLKIDPDNFAANYYLAFAWMEKAEQRLREFEDSNKGMSEAAQAEENAKINDLFRNALSPLERAYEINPNERAVVLRLAYVYYRLGESDPLMDAKYEKFKKIGEAMEDK